MSLVSESSCINEETIGSYSAFIYVNDASIELCISSPYFAIQSANTRERDTHMQTFPKRQPCTVLPECLRESLQLPGPPENLYEKAEKICKEWVRLAR